MGIPSPFPMILFLVFVAYQYFTLSFPLCMCAFLLTAGLVLIGTAILIHPLIDL